MKLSRNACIEAALLGLVIFALGIYYPFAKKDSVAISPPESLSTKAPQGKAPKKFSEVAWGQVGAGGYRAAAQWMVSNNGKGRSLDKLQKRYLRPHFGDLVDRVEIVYDAVLMDEWVAASFRVDVGQSNAQVYGYRVYIKDSYHKGKIQQLILLAHELVHVQQYEKLGSLNNFGYQYFKEYKRANQQYRQNRMEAEAFTFEKKFAKWLRQQIAQDSASKN